jgi:hypothetical protein
LHYIRVIFFADSCGVSTKCEHVTACMVGNGCRV